MWEGSQGPHSLLGASPSQDINVVTTFSLSDLKEVLWTSYY